MLVRWLWPALSSTSAVVERNGDRARLLAHAGRMKFHTLMPQVITYSNPELYTVSRVSFRDLYEQCVSVLAPKIVQYHSELHAVRFTYAPYHIFGNRRLFRSRLTVRAASPKDLIESERFWDVCESTEEFRRGRIVTPLLMNSDGFANAGLG